MPSRLCHWLWSFWPVVGLGILSSTWQLQITKIVISSFWIMIEMQKLEEIKAKKDTKVRQG
jgi:hypothetical protein